MTIKGVIEENWPIDFPLDVLRVGYTIRFRRPKPLVSGEQVGPKIIGWDKFGPRFEPLYDYVDVTIESLEDLELLQGAASNA